MHVKSTHKQVDKGTDNVLDTRHTGLSASNEVAKANVVGPHKCTEDNGLDSVEEVGHACFVVLAELTQLVPDIVQRDFY